MHAYICFNPRLGSSSPSDEAKSKSKSDDEVYLLSLQATLSFVEVATLPGGGVGTFPWFEGALFFWAARVERCADVDFGLWWPADLRNHLLAKVVFPTAPKRSITCYKDMHSDRVDSRGRSNRSIMIYLCLLCEYSSSSCPCLFSWEESKRMSVHDIECTFSVAQQYWSLSLANLISSLSIFVYFTCRKQTLQWMQGEMLHSWHDYITDHEAPFVSPIITAFLASFCWVELSGRPRGRVIYGGSSRDDGKDTCLTGCRSSSSNVDAGQSNGMNNWPQRKAVCFDNVFSGWHDAPPFLRCTM